MPLGLPWVQQLCFWVSVRKSGHWDVEEVSSAPHVHCGATHNGQGRDKVHAEGVSGGQVGMREEGRDRPRTRHTVLRRDRVCTWGHRLTPALPAASLG